MSISQEHILKMKNSGISCIYSTKWIITTYCGQTLSWEVSDCCWGKTLSCMSFGRYRRSAMSCSNYDEQQTATAAIVENIQRENLSAIEEALAYQQILDTQNITQEELAQKVGKKQ